MDDFACAFAVLAGEPASRRRSIGISDIGSVKTGCDRKSDDDGVSARPSLIRAAILPEPRIPLEDLAFLRLPGGSPTALSHCLIPIANDGTELLVAVQRTVHLVHVPERDFMPDELNASPLALQNFPADDPQLVIVALSVLPSDSPHLAPCFALAVTSTDAQREDANALYFFGNGLAADSTTTDMAEVSQRVGLKFAPLLVHPLAGFTKEKAVHHVMLVSGCDGSVHVFSRRSVSGKKRKGGGAQNKPPKQAEDSALTEDENTAKATATGKPEQKVMESCAMVEQTKQSDLTEWPEVALMAGMGPVWAIDVKYAGTMRVVAAGDLYGRVLHSVVEIKSGGAQVLRSECITLDGPVASLLIFSSSLHTSAFDLGRFAASQVGVVEDSLRPDATPCGPDTDINLVVCAEVGYAALYLDTVHCGLSNASVLPGLGGGGGAERDALLSACWSDVYLDGTGEILLGTHGGQILGYRVSPRFRWGDLGGEEVDTRGGAGGPEDETPAQLEGQRPLAVAASHKAGGSDGRSVPVGVGPGRSHAGHRDQAQGPGPSDHSPEGTRRVPDVTVTVQAATSSTQTAVGAVAGDSPRATPGGKTSVPHSSWQGEGGPPGAQTPSRGRREGRGMDIPASGSGRPGAAVAARGPEGAGNGLEAQAGPVDAAQVMEERIKGRAGVATDARPESELQVQTAAAQGEEPAQAATVVPLPVVAAAGGGTQAASGTVTSRSTGKRDGPGPGLPGQVPVTPPIQAGPSGGGGVGTVEAPSIRKVKSSGALRALSLGGGSRSPRAAVAPSKPAVDPVSSTAVATDKAAAALAGSGAPLSVSVAERAPRLSMPKTLSPTATRLQPSDRGPHSPLSLPPPAADPALMPPPPMYMHPRADDQRRLW